MKQVLILGAIVVAALAGCKKEEPQSDSQIYLKGTVQVPKRSAVTSFDAIAIDTAGKILTITGTKYDVSGTVDESVTIIVPNFTGSGTFNFDQQQGEPVAQAQYYVYDRGRSYAKSGSVTVTVSKQTLSGTFSFACNDSVKVENGTFSVPKL